MSQSSTKLALVSVLILSALSSSVRSQESPAAEAAPAPAPAPAAAAAAEAKEAEGCASDDVTFELLTGYVFTAPDDFLDTRPDTLLISDCIDLCRRNDSCQALNYETGLCVLFKSHAGQSPSK